MKSEKEKNKLNSFFQKHIKEEYLILALLMLFQVFLVLLSNSKLSGEDDLFWYLSTGRYIVQTGDFPSTDVFGFTTTGANWIPFEWFWDVINFSLFSAGGYFALSILSTLLILLIFYLLFHNLKNLKINYFTMFFFLIILALGICLRMTVKPHLISYLSLVLILSILINYRYVERNRYQLLYFIPFIFLFWVNMHMGVLSGLFLLTLFFCSEFLASVFPKYFSSQPAGSDNSSIRNLNRKELLRLAVIIFISSIFILINPHGIKTFQYAFHIVSMNQLDKIYEWQSPFTGNYLYTFSNFVYYFFILGILPVLYFSIKRKDFFPAALCLGYFLYSLTAARFTTDFMLLSIIFIAAAYQNLFKGVFRNNFRFLKTYSAQLIVPFSIAGVIIILLIFLIPGNRLYSGLGINRTFGIGIDNNNFPVKMFKFISSSGLDSIGNRPFNTYETGGFFIWNFPEKKNFIGSRGINDEVWNDYTNIINLQDGFENKIDSLKFDYITWMVPFLDYSQNPGLLNNGLLSYLFTRSDKWKLVYWDDNSLLFVNNEPKFKDFISFNEYKYMNPYKFFSDFQGLKKEFSENKESFQNEISRKQKEDPYGNLKTLMNRYFNDKLK